MARKQIYRVIFHNQGKLYELHAGKVASSDLYGFVEVADLIFGERSAVVVDPSEERLKAEFSAVKRTYVPMHAVIRIDEVSKQGANKIVALEAGANVTPFPVPLYGPGGGDSGSS